MTDIIRDSEPTRPEHEPIPGERDPGNLTHREPGAIGGHFNGEDIPTSERAASLDDITALEHVREGGGADAVEHYKRR